MRSTILAAVAMVALVSGPALADSPKKPDVGAGRVAWFDITTTDLAKSKDFYTKLFDWKYTAMKGTDLGVEIVSGDQTIGSLRVAEGKLSPYDGVVYIQVNDIQASCKKARELGAFLVPGFPFNLPDGGGSIGLIADPAGHPVGMYSRTSLPETKPAAK